MFFISETTAETMTTKKFFKKPLVFHMRQNCYGSQSLVSEITVKQNSKKWRMCRRCALEQVEEPSLKSVKKKV